MGRGSHRKKKKGKIPYKYIPPVIEYIYNTEFNLYIQESNIKNSGLGVFSNQLIPKNTYIGNYIGELKENGSFTCGTYAISLKSNNFIDAYDYPRCIFAMINDSRFSNFKYNCDFITFEDHVEVWTIDDINEGDELYCDYGDRYWDHR